MSDCSAVGGRRDEESSSSETQRRRGDIRRGGVRKAQQEYLECLEALSATQVSTDDSCQAPTSLQKERRSVSFATTGSFFEYDYSPTDDLLGLKLSGKIWYTEDDEEEFKAQARRDVAMFKRLQKGDTDGCPPQHNLCLVGLEQHLVSPDYTKKRARTKKLLTYAVLGAQKWGVVNDPELIAKTARRYSEWSVEQAKKFGDFQRLQSIEK
ncbi:hypothetical protein ACHAXM_003126 [Skeletonema potamos]|jgi:hypothetical protein